MRNISLLGVVALLAISGCVSVNHVNFEAFTHPVNSNDIPLYYKPCKFYSYLQSDTEAGWVVKIKKKHSRYFLVKLPEECNLSKKNVWIKAGDVGVVVQNYDSIKIPLYKSANTLSKPIKYIYSSSIGEIYDIKKKVVLLDIILDSGEVVHGWVEKKYLCGNPYTTCN